MTMKRSLGLVLLCLLASLSIPAHADTNPSDRRWFALAIISLLAERGSSEPGIFYSTQYQFEPGILVRTQRKERLTLSLGVTENTFTIGPSLRIGESKLHLAGGVASEQDRLFTFPFLCLSWRWSPYY